MSVFFRVASLAALALTTACATNGYGYAPQYPPGYDSGMGSGQYYQPGDLFGGQNVADVRAFYEPLAPYGQWTESQFGYAFRPQVDQNWRPYVNGRWGENRLWLSDDPWGWATDHYGRWGFDQRIGWVWVPGTEWAPSWVAWREDDRQDVAGWAPVPPGVAYSFGVGFGSALAYNAWNDWYAPSWVWVPRRNLYAPGFGGGVLPWRYGQNYWRGSHWNHRPPGWNGNGRPPGYNNGRPPGYNNGRPPGYNNGRPPGYNTGRPPAYDGNGRPPRYNNGRPPGYDGSGRPLVDNNNGRPAGYTGNGRPPAYDGNGRPPEYNGTGRPSGYNGTGRPLGYSGAGRPSGPNGNGRPPGYVGDGVQVQQAPRTGYGQPGTVISTGNPRGKAQGQPPRNASAGNRPPGTPPPQRQAAAAAPPAAAPTPPRAARQPPPKASRNSSENVNEQPQ